MASDDRVPVGEAHAKVPRILPDADLTPLPLGPLEGFVVSRIDGKTTVEEISDVTGVDRARVEDVIKVLLEFGVAEYTDPPARSVPPGRRTSSIEHVRSPSGVIQTKPVPVGAPRALYDPAELEEPGVEIDIDRRRVILDTFYRVDDLSFYELLGVAEDAEKVEVRRAYFRLSKVFHPDTMFGKELGAFKSKMEVVFNRLTEAYEVLGKQRTRDEYDNYMRLRNRTRAVQNSVDQATREAERIEREANRAAHQAVVDRKSIRPPATPPGVERPAIGGRSSAPAAGTSPSTGPSSPSGTPSTIRPRTVAHASSSPAPEPETPEREMSAAGRARQRELMARKLAAATGRRLGVRGSTRPSTAVEGPEHVVGRSEVLKGLAGSLKQAASHTGGVDRALIHLEHAREAEAQGNLVAAVNALRLALAMTGERPDVLAEYERVRSAYAVSMADTYEKQAKYESRTGRWGDAALSWSKVCDGRPEDGLAHLNAAIALLEAKGDLSSARAYAQTALDLMPGNVLAHRALGRVYAAAGMGLNARRELEKVVKMDPHDDEMKALLKSLAGR